MNYETTNQIRGKELDSKQPCAEGCERCWCNIAHKNRCY